MDTGWIAFNKRTEQLLHLARLDGWEVEAVIFQEDDLFGLFDNKLYPIEDEL